MTDPGTAPDNDLPYASHAGEDIDERDMEALAANAEQDWDMATVIRHNLYIGWVMGLLNGKDVEQFGHGGGNRLEIHLTDRIQPIVVIVPYPPKDWKP